MSGASAVPDKMENCALVQRMADGMLDSLEDFVSQFPVQRLHRQYRRPSQTSEEGARAREGMTSTEEMERGAKRKRGVGGDDVALASLSQRSSGVASSPASTQREAKGETTLVLTANYYKRSTIVVPMNQHLSDEEPIHLRPCREISNIPLVRPDEPSPAIKIWCVFRN